MTISTEVPPGIAAQWQSAVAHAGLNEDEVHLLAIAGQAADDEPKAASYPAGKHLIDEPGDLIRGPALAEANSAEIVDMQRVAVYADFDSDDPTELAVMAAKLRHELRHAEQRLSPSGDELFALDELAEQLVEWKVGGMPGSALLYNLKPIEIDANAAAATFLRDHHPIEITEILRSDDAALARSKTSSGAIEDLRAKTVAFMFMFREIAEDPARTTALSFEERLGQISASAATCWQALTNGIT